MEITDSPAGHHLGGILNLFQGATIYNLVINGNMTKSGQEYYQTESTKTDQGQYSDEEIAQALSNIVGKGKPINMKQKWAGALWYLRWECNFPFKPQDFCERIDMLPLPNNLEYTCDYNNIRPLATLSFMNEDPRHMESVKYSKNDEQAFFMLRGVVVALDEELKKIRLINNMY